tara:strand:- start:292 stop:927 length:636 start_codon:yes stop_codon:yes gene_type:complete
MSGYIGQREKRRRKRIIFFFSFIIIVVSLFYLYFNQNIDTRNFESDFIIEEENSIESTSLSKEDYKIKIFEKDQKIIFRDKQIDKLKKNINELKDINKILSENNEKLNSEIFNNTQTQDNKKIKSLNLELIKLNNLVKKLELQKDNLQSKNNENILQNDIIKDQIQSINNEKTNLSMQKNLLLEKNKKLEKIIKDQERLIKELEDTTHHNR